MTKERRLAIQMWEEISWQTPNNINAYKEDFCRKHHLNWQYGCWFCQYVRQDYRENLASREDILVWYNGCQKCPIYKYNQCTADECGCNHKFKTSMFKQTAKIIVRLLKGEKLWDTGEE